MNRFFKAGLLVLTLVIPALIFVLLQLFATNHYAIPFFNPAVDNVGNIQMIGKDTVFQKQLHLSFKDLTVDSTISLDLEGKYNLINYLPSHCVENCDLLLDQLKRIYALNSEIENLRIITFSDSLAINKVLFDKIHQTSSWNTYVISKDTRDQLFVDSLLFDRQNILVRTSFPSNQLVLIDDMGYFRGYYKMDDLDESERLMAELKVLKYETNH